MVTDYDCWHEEEEPVTVETLIGYLTKNSGTAQRLVKEIVHMLPEKVDCECHHALENAILTLIYNNPPTTKKKLKEIKLKSVE